MLTLVKTDRDAAYQMWVMMAIVWVVVSTTMFTAQMEFFAKVGDLCAVFHPLLPRLIELI